MEWIAYHRLNPVSPVRCYETDQRHISVVLEAGGKFTEYLFATTRVGSKVQEMASLAASGKGLGTYISQNFPRGTKFYDSKRELARLPPMR